MSSQNNIDILHLMLEGKSAEICDEIKSSVDQCTQDTIQTYAQGFIDQEHQQRVLKQINTEYQEAFSHHHLLTRTDNRLKQDTFKNFVIKKHFETRQIDSDQVFNYSLIELLDENNAWQYDPQLISAVKLLQPMLNQSLRTRIKMLWCWDEILQVFQDILLLEVLNLGRQLMYSARVLESEDQVAKVKSLLSQFDLTHSNIPLNFNIPSKTHELHQFLQTGTNRLDKLNHMINQLNTQRDQIASAITTLQGQLTKPDTSAIKKQMTNPSNPILPKQKNSRMTFHNKHN